jgi:beta-lactamase regulating signal transducer with metallopeptidase domain
MIENLTPILQWFNQIAVVVFMQSAVVILLGLTLAGIFRRQGSLVQASIYRATFVGVCASPILATALSGLGVAGLPLKLPLGAEANSPIKTTSDTFNETSLSLLARDADTDIFVERESAVANFETTTDRSLGEASEGFAPVDLMSNADGQSNPTSPSSWLLLVLSIVPTIWLLGTMVLLTKFIVELRRVRKLCESSIAVNESVRQLAIRVAAALQVKTPTVGIHDLISSPCVTGFWSPVVLLPSDSRDPAAQEKSLIHELAHLSRADVKWNFVQRVVCVLFPQPLLWWLVYRMETVAEDVCDDFVVKFTHDRAGYAQQLVDLAESQQILANIAGLGMFSSSRSLLYSRVQRILDSSRQLSIRLSGRGVMLVAVLLIALSTAGSIFRHQLSVEPLMANESFDSNSLSSNDSNPKATEILGDSRDPIRQEDEKDDAAENLVEVRGVVRDAKSLPVADADVVADWLHGQRELKTDASGEYSVMIPKDSLHYVQIRAFAEKRLSQGIHLQQRNEIPAASNMVTINIDLAPVRIINVQVQDGAGSPVEGATVLAVSSERGVSDLRRRMDTTVSDSKGNASLIVPIQMPIGCVVAIKPDQGVDYQPARVGDKLAFPTEKPVTFPENPFVLKLTGIQPIEVTVQSDYGVPLPNAKVKVVSIAPKSDRPPALDSGSIGQFEFITDEEGKVVLNVLPDWCTKAFLRADVAGYATAIYKEYNPKFHKGKVTISASKLVPVNGKVVDEGNSPVPNLKLQFYASGARSDSNTGFDFSSTTTTDANGKFRVELPEDTGCLARFNISGIALADAKPFVIEAGKPVPDQVYRTCKATRIFGRVTAGPDRAPVSNVNVWFVHKVEADNVPIPNAMFGNYRATLSRQISTVSQSDGRFEVFAGPGDYLLLSPREPIENEHEFSINNEHVFECNIHLEKYGKLQLKGQITSADPRVNVEGLRVHWQYLVQTNAFADQDTHSSKGGGFEFERAKHRVLALVESPDHRHAGFAVIEPEDAEAKIALRPTATATGIVVDAKTGNPLAGSEFQICHQIRYGQSTTSIKFPMTVMTDADGLFRAPGLAVGLKYTIQKVNRGKRHPNDMSWRDVHEFTPVETEQIDLGVITVAETPRQLSESEMLDERIAQIFEEKKAVADRLNRALEIAKYSAQNVAVLVGDPKSKPIRDLVESTMRNRQLVSELPDYVLRGVSLPMKEVTRSALAKAGVEVAGEDASPIFLFVLDSKGQLLDQFADRDLLLDGEFNINGLIGALEEHSLQPLAAKEVLDAALAKAKQENKRLIVQQTATWCGPCWTLSQYLERTRSVWEKDYVWVKIDNRWTGAIELMEELRGRSQGGVPWFAILDADRKTLVTSNDSKGENVGYPSDAGSKAHFRNMIQTTATRLTEAEIDQLMSGFDDK